MVRTVTFSSFALLALSSLLLTSTPTLATGKCQYKEVTETNGKTWRQYETAATRRDDSFGWNFLPTKDICKAKLVRDWTVTAEGGTIPYYVTNDNDFANLKRAVVVIAGKNRDVWSYFNLMRNARNRAAARMGVNAKKIAVFGPMYFTAADKNAGSASAKDLYWKGDNWSSGANAQGPEGTSATSFSTFQGLDMFLDRIATMYPTIGQIVVAGHSMGAQMVDRYITVRKSTAKDSKPTSYFIGNPGSWVWLEEDRPVSTTKCKGIDDYKYGLSAKLPPYAEADYASNGSRDGMFKRIKQRYVHLLVGAKDFGPSDTKCQALTQGANHKERGMNFASSVTKINGGKLPKKWSFDIVPGCSHNDWCMFSKDVSLTHLFVGKNGVMPKRRLVDEEEQVAPAINQTLVQMTKPRHRLPLLPRKQH